ncbi:MAG: dolichol kinase [Halobacteriales archaeon]|nr:dolichol kinase [Halobacteriales archaeon]
MKTDDLELGRRLFHASGGLFVLVYVFGFLPWKGLGALLVLATVVSGVLEFLRIFTEVADKVPVLGAVYGRLTRPYENDSPAGYFYYVFSMTVAWLVFPPFAGVPGMLMLAFGDPFSGILTEASSGETKEAWVLVAMFFFCFLVIALPYLYTATSLSTGGVVLVSAGGALGATAADGANVEVRGFFLDDNLTIPLVSGLVIRVLAAPAALFL